MVVKEFVIKQAAKQVLPLASKLSDKNLRRFLSLARKIAPTEFTRWALDSMNRLIEEQHPSGELMRRAAYQLNPRVKERFINNLLIKQYWYGAVKRGELQSQGLSAPFTFLISPTMRCNLRCAGCYASDYSKKDDLEIEVIDRVLSEGKELGIFYVSICGGEPFIRQDLWEIYKRHDEISFQVYTNGTFIDKGAARKMAELGNITILFSLEGFAEETDARRGKGIFRMVMQGMDNLQEVGVPFGFSTMVTRHNVDTVISDEFNDMMIEKGCLIGWHFRYIPTGLNPDISPMLTAEQRELMRVRGARRIRNEKPLLTIDLWDDAPVTGGYISGPSHFFHINSRGDVEPCIFIPLAMDNIHDKSLREVINSPFFKGFGARQSFCENLLRPCSVIDCPQVLREICSVESRRIFDEHPAPRGLFKELVEIIVK